MVANGMREGWNADPWGRWQERWFHGGYPTDLVRSGAVEGSDPVGSPPPAAAWGMSPGPAAIPSSHAAWGPSPVPGWPSSPVPPAGPHWGPPGGYGYYAGPSLPKGGDARTGPLPLHPMSLSDVLDGAFKLLRANFRTIVILVTALTAPLQLVSALASRSLLGGQGLFSFLNQASNGTTVQTQRSSGATLASLLTSLATLLILPLAAGAISRVVAASYLGMDMAPGTALRAAGRRFFPLLFAWLVVHLLEVVGGIALLLPGLLLMSLSVAVAPAIVMEALGPIQGIKRSWHLIRGRVWPILGIALLSGLIVTIVSGVVSAVPQTLAVVVGLHWGWILLFVGGMLSSLISFSLTAIVATLVYFDGRIRKEGFDLQVIASGLGW